MLCRNPFIKDPTGKVFKMHDKSQWYKGIPFGCGQCLPCRINRRRIWTLRMMLEFMVQQKGLFITLTYDDEHLPHSPSGRPTLVKKDYQDFMKRFRKAIYPLTVRFFACGEYGSKTERPHYHAIIFGVGEDCSQHVADSWHAGMVAVGSCTFESIQYVAGYCLKKLVNEKQDTEDRQKEFILTSRRPGLGVPAIDSISQAIKNHPEPFNIGDFDSDVPGSLHVSGRNLPLGRLMISKLRTAMGIDPERENFDYICEMRDKFFDTESYRLHYDDDLFNVFGPLGTSLVSEDAQKAKNIEGRLRIFNKRNKI